MSSLSPSNTPNPGPESNADPKTDRTNLGSTGTQESALEPAHDEPGEKSDSRALQPGADSEAAVSPSRNSDSGNTPKRRVRENQPHSPQNSPQKAGLGDSRPLAMQVSANATPALQGANKNDAAKSGRPAKTRNEQAESKINAKSGKRGGALLERALERASSRNEVRDHELEGPIPGTGYAKPSAASADNGSPGYAWIPVSTVASRTEREIEVRDRTIVELHGLIAQTISEISALHAEQAALGEGLAASCETIRSEGVSVEKLRLAIEANATSLGTRDAEISELRRDFAESRALAERRAEQIADDERLAAKRDRRIEQLLRSVDRAESAMTERDVELDSLRALLGESKRVVKQRNEVIEQLRREGAREAGAARAQSEELQTLRNAIAEAQRSARNRNDEIETMRRSLARTDEDLRSRDREIAALRETLIEGESVYRERAGELDRQSRTLALQGDEITRLRETALSLETTYRASLAEKTRSATSFEERLAGQIDANSALKHEISRLEGQNEALQTELERECTARAKSEEVHAEELGSLRAAVAENESRLRDADRDLPLLNRALELHKAHAAARDLEMAGLRQQLADLQDAAPNGEENHTNLFRELLAEQTLLHREDQRPETRAPAASAEDDSPGVKRALRARPRGLDPESEVSLLSERLAQRDAEIETLQRVIAAANGRNATLRAELSSPRNDDVQPRADVDSNGALDPAMTSRAAGPAPNDAPPPSRVNFEARATPAAAPPVTARKESAKPFIKKRTGWRAFPGRRRRKLEKVFLAPEIVNPAPPEAIALAPFVAGPPTFNAPTDPGLPVSDPANRPAIFHYWKRTQITSKLNQPQIGSADDFFLSYLLDLCNRNPKRTNRIVSIGTGSHDLEVVLARRALDAGVTNFNIHCLAEVPSTLRFERATDVERTVVANLTLLQCRMETWPIEQPYSLVILNESLHQLANPGLWIDRIVSALAPSGRVLVHSPFVDQNGARGGLAREIANEIWQLLPDQHKAREEEGSEMPYPATSIHSDPDLDSGAPNILKLLAARLEFEVFLAFGNVINAFVDDKIGRSFDPENEQDRCFIDQVATVDDDKVDAGLIPPTQMLAALATEPQDRVAYRHWTPEFCLGRD